MAYPEHDDDDEEDEDDEAVDKMFLVNLHPHHNVPKNDNILYHNI